MTDPTPKPWWPPHAIRRHVQEPTPDAGPADPPTWPEDAVQEVERLRLAGRLLAARAERAEAEVMRYQSGSAYEVGYDHGSATAGLFKARAGRAESNARGKQAVIEAQRATLDRVRALHGVWNCTQNVNWLRQRISDRWPELGRALDDLRAVLDVPQPEADPLEDVSAIESLELPTRLDELLSKEEAERLRADLKRIADGRRQAAIDGADMVIGGATPQPEAGGDDEPKGLHSPHCNPGCLGFTHYLGSANEEHLHHADQREVCEACVDPAPEAGGDDE